MNHRVALIGLVALVGACSSGAQATDPTVPVSVETTAAPVTTIAPETTSVPTSSPATTSTTSVPAARYAATIEELLAIGRPIVLAHTAGEDEFPASTLYAFGESVKAGVDMLDLNINLTGDGDLLVQHDDTVDRNTDGVGAVASMTVAELQQFDAAHWFSIYCADCRDLPESDYLYRGIRTGRVPPPAGYTADDFALPTLRQLVERFPDIPLNIEIKGTGDIAMNTADVLAQQLDELGRAGATVVSSFEDDVVAYFRSIAPDVEVSPGLDVLTKYVLEGVDPPAGMRILQLPPVYSGITVITPELIARSTAKGFPIWVWPNDRDLENLDAYRSFLDMGIVGLNINFPGQAVQAVADHLAARG
jgi:glycerophosphoryl diester phosphodiesterase